MGLRIPLINIVLWVTYLSCKILQKTGMDPPKIIYGTEQEYLNNILRLVNTSTTFLNMLKQTNVKKMHGKTGRLDLIQSKIASAEVTNVARLSTDVVSLDAELRTLMSKLHLVQGNYKTDTALSHFLGNYKKTPADTTIKLLNYVDDCLTKTDSVVAACCKIEKNMNVARHRITSILVSRAEEKTWDKARRSNEVLKELTGLSREIKGNCHNAQSDLLKISSSIRQYTSKVRQKLYNY